MTKRLKLSQGKAEKDDIVFRNEEGPGGLALRNPIIMDRISSFLDDRDLCQWYGSSRIFKDIIERMDDSTWRRRTQKLAKALNVDIPPERTFRAMFPIFKKEVDSLISRIHGPDKFSPTYGLTLDLVRAAARLAHYGQKGFNHMILQDLDLSTVPGEHLCSLASSVRNMFSIRAVKGCNLIKMIDSVKCNTLALTNQNLDREAAEALVQAMETRIEQLEIFNGKMFRVPPWGSLNLATVQNPELEEEDIKRMLDTNALTKYSGKGRCKYIVLEVGQVYKYRQWLRDWALDRDWSIMNDAGWGMCVQRKTEE